MASETRLVRTEQYGYDELSRLTSVDYRDGQTQTYTLSGKEAALPPSPPLRTVRASFPAHGSSLAHSPPIGASS